MAFQWIIHPLRRSPRGTEQAKSSVLEGEIQADTFAYEEVPRLGIAAQGFGVFLMQRFFALFFLSLVGTDGAQ
jgi:hypothetical protein